MKVAVLGCGHWGKNLVRVFAKMGHLAAVCDPDVGGRVRAQNLLKGADVPIVDTLEALSEDIDAWVVATPACSHSGLCERGLRAGKHIFVEKPIAMHLAEAEALFELAEQQQRLLFAGHVFEYHPAIQRILELRDVGYLGDVTHIFSEQLGRGRVRPEEDVVFSLAPHDVSMLLALVPRMPEVTSTGSEHVSPGHPGVATIALDWGHGLVGNIHVSWIHPEKVRRLVVVGTRRSVVFDDVKHTLVGYERSEDLQRPFGDAEPIWYTTEEPLQAECQAFVADALAYKGFQDFGRYRRIMRVLEAARDGSSEVAG